MKLFRTIVILIILIVTVFCFKTAYDITREIMIWEINPDSYLDVHMNRVQ